MNIRMNIIHRGKEMMYKKNDERKKKVVKIRSRYADKINMMLGIR